MVLIYSKGNAAECYGVSHAEDGEISHGQVGPRLRCLQDIQAKKLSGTKVVERSVWESSL